VQFLTKIKKKNFPAAKVDKKTIRSALILYSKSYKLYSKSTIFPEKNDGRGSKMLVYNKL
jgi:hypothetical protein